MGNSSRSRLLVAVAVAAFAGAAAAQYPERPIRLVVPQAAGSATDNVARAVPEHASTKEGL